MITCPCGYRSDAPPDSPEWHRGHREQHLARYPNVDANTRLALDKLVAIAEAYYASGARLPS